MMRPGPGTPRSKGRNWPGQGGTSFNCATFHDRDLGTRRAMGAGETMFRSACAHRFSAYSIECGEDLAASSAVTVVERGPPSFVARVGDESASIVARASSPRMFASCTCKIFALGLDGCRHLWALVATLEDTKVVGPSVLRQGFDLVPRHPPSAAFWIGARRLLDPDEATRARVARRRRARGASARARARESPRAGLRRAGLAGSVAGVQASRRRRRRA